MWRDPRTVVGGSDAGAHLDMMCGAVYSTLLLGPAVRRARADHARGGRPPADRRAGPAVRPARPGRIAEGWRADLVVFDPATVGHGPERTATTCPAAPAGSYADAVGVEHVLVNGVAIVARRRATGAPPGTLLRSGRDTVSVLLEAWTAIGTSS